MTTRMDHHAEGNKCFLEVTLLHVRPISDMEKLNMLLECSTYGCLRRAHAQPSRRRLTYRHTACFHRYSRGSTHTETLLQQTKTRRASSASLTTASASSRFPASGSRFSFISNAHSPSRAKCSCSALPNLEPSVKRSPNSPSGTFIAASGAPITEHQSTPEKDTTEV